MNCQHPINHNSQSPKKKHKICSYYIVEDMSIPSENSRFPSEDKIETELL